MPDLTVVWYHGYTMPQAHCTLNYKAVTFMLPAAAALKLICKRLTATSHSPSRRLFVVLEQNSAAVCVRPVHYKHWQRSTLSCPQYLCCSVEHAKWMCGVIRPSRGSAWLMCPAKRRIRVHYRMVLHSLSWHHSACSWRHLRTVRLWPCFCIIVMCCWRCRNELLVFSSYQL